MCNKELREILRQHDIYMWQVAKKLGIHETSLVRWFREELSVERKQQVMYSGSVVKTKI